ncbi:cytochrome c oxidase polypeptide II [Caballeronia catudaia]|uniref:Cytochrome c oxidase polypeptide II n=1 Tax=Caballeronia catudaia TaxID=1777136 RepID=A0A157ZIL7_9BURK|nr:cytochrome c oxidase subunit II [Caballeronia catudaia]SAK45392.1 cytochrome c oxidase polypeptide II [Caballeronia catudaia]
MQSALNPAGIQASRILDLWHLTLGVCCAVFAAILLACLIAMIRAPRAGRDTRADVSFVGRPEARMRFWVIAATALSTFLLFGLVLADVLTDRALSRLPVDNALRIEMTGYQWWWQARYLRDGDAPEFTLANELHVPVGRPVIVSLKAADVIHTFWVPNLHGKKDMIPGRDATIEFRADKAGVYRGQCAEFCGYEHALMAFSITADPPAQYEAWAARQRKPADAPSEQIASRGRDVFMVQDCARCHTVRGTGAQGTIGPDLTHIASRRTLAAGTLANDRGHLAGWIVDPRAHKPGTAMPPTRLPPDDLQALLTWMETLE